MIKYKDDPIKEKDVWWTRTTAIVGKIFGMVGLVIEELRAGALRCQSASSCESATKTAARSDGQAALFNYVDESTALTRAAKAKTSRPK